MPHTDLKPTAQIRNEIVAFVRAGGHPEVAAEAAGVPREVFLDWMARAERPRAAKALRELAEAVRTAAAKARLTAETEVRSGKPLDWLKCGPNKDAPAWTAPARAGDPIPELSLDDPRLRHLASTILDALDDMPDARARVAEALTKKGA